MLYDHLVIRYTHLDSSQRNSSCIYFLNHELHVVDMAEKPTNHGALRINIASEWMCSATELHALGCTERDTKHKEIYCQPLVSCKVCFSVP